MVSPIHKAGGSVNDPLGNDSIDISLPGRGPRFSPVRQALLLDAGAGKDTVYGWSNISLTTALGGAGEDSLPLGLGQTINADRISSTITKGLFEGGLGTDTISLQANTVSGTTVSGGGGSIGSSDSC